MALINPLLGSNLVTGVVFDSTLIGNSVWLNGSDEDINRTGFTLSSDGQKEFIISMWVNFNEFGRAQQLFAFGNPTGIASFNDMTQCTLNADNTIGFSVGSGGSSGGGITTTRLFRDIGWYHLLFTFNSNTSVLPATDRIRLYVNGELQTGSQTAVPDNQDVRGSLTGDVDLRFGKNTHPSLLYFYKGYYSQVCYLEGKSLQAGDFAVSDFLDTFTMGTNGSQFIPKKDSEIAALATTVGGNSACLDFANSSDLGNDISDNNKDFTATNMAAANQSVHTPSKVYPVMNLLDQDHSTSTTLSEGNLKVSMGTSAGDGVRGTLPYSGKIYWEVEIDSISSNSGSHIGIATNNHNLALTADDTSGNGQRDAFVGVSSFSSNLTGFISGSNFDSSYGGLGNNFGTAGKYLMFAVDIDAGKFWAGYDGTWFNSGNPAAGSNDSGKNLALYDKWFPAISRIGSAGSEAFIFNFGQSSFAHTPPSGFQSLNSSILTAPDYQGIDYFDATLYEGNGTGQRVGDFVPFTDSETVANSIIFNDDDTAHLTRTYTTPTAATAFTFSCWFKPGSSTNDQYFLSTGTNDASEGYIAINHSTGGGQIWIADPNAGASAFGVRTNGTFIDSSQWYHLCLGINSAASSGSRVKLEINGVEQTLVNDLGITTQIEPSSSQAMKLNGATDFTIGRRHRTGSDIYDGYMANVYFIDGEKKQASDFGQLDTSTNRWVAKAYTGDFNNNGYKLAFGTAPGTGSGAGTDTSGEGHNWTENNFGTNDQVIDTPSKNYAVYNTVKGAVYTAMSLSQGNLTTKTGNGSVALAAGFPIQDGYWYYEVNFVEDAANMVFGLYNPATTVTASDSNPTLTGIKENGGTVVIEDNGASNSIAGPTLSNPSAGDVVGIYIRKVGNSYGMWFSLNGTAMNNTPAATATATPDIGFAASMELVPAAHYSNPGTKEAQTNFGQLLQFDGGATSFNAASDGYWKHAPVTGFKALNQDNLDDTASKLTAWAWIKNRDADDSHILVDRVRGVGKDLHSDSDTSSGIAPAEVTNMNTVQRFLQRGVQIGSDVEVNTANESYVLWQWLMGDSATTGTAISADNPPSLASTSLVADAGHLAIISYTGNATSGATIGHGMSAAPEMIWIKERDNANGWVVGSDVLGYTKVLRLDTKDGEATDSGAFNNTAPSSTLITLGSNNGTNRSSGQMICYAFRSVPGVCKIGSYTGNGNNNGPYISVGFLPKYVLVKSTTANRNWNALDTTRNSINIASPFVLLPNDDAVDTAGQIGAFDILADGFKPRDTAANSNASGETYIYMAIADLGGNGTLPPIYGR